MRLYLIPLLTYSAFAAPGFGAKLPSIPLWEKGAPDEKGNLGPEGDTSTAKDNRVSGKPVMRLGNVSAPDLTMYMAPKEKNTGAAVVVFPGGGYNILAMDLEGTEICEWLNSLGINAALVKYRVPARPNLPRYAAPLQDAQRAMSIVRKRAKDWGIDSTRIGVLGFSAGAHLAAALSNNYEKPTYEVPNGEKVSMRPDFCVLVYPAYLTMKDQGDRISPELNVTARTPPTFLVQTEDDGVRVENSLYYYLALKNAKVPAEMHIYSSGGHGYGLRPSRSPVASWPHRAEEWFRSLGLLKADK